ncbi:MAG: polymer-forming cytoskeletal protein [Patescibacteria group bacterium]|nr:polymer-forming cytoskeletal protein [Patescibacteria group bacterium]
MTKTRLIIIFSLIFFLVSPLAVKAFSIKTGDSVYIAEDETIEGSLYSVATNITIDGTIKGDVICAGQSININGKVEGDVICAGQSINISGEIGGNLRVAGNSINLGGKIARNVNAFGASIILDKNAEVGWSMLFAGATMEARGKVGQDLYGASPKVTIAGEIGRDVRIKLRDKIRAENKGISYHDKNELLIIADNAKIGRNLTYTGSNEADISEKSFVVGEIKHNLPKAEKGGEFRFVGWFWGRLYSIFAALVIGLVLISLWRKQIVELTDRMLEKVGASIGWGAVIMFLTPIISILLLFTFIGIPLALLLLGVWAIALFAAKILTGIMIGRNLLEKFWKNKKDSLIWAMIVGIVICWFIFSIPFVGWILALVALWWGLGGIWLAFRKA